jgi:xanthine dehydrogenase YagS FAD-binding subunit
MTVIHPRSLSEAAAYAGEYRAGGTDVEARRRIGLAGEVTIDLRHIPGLTGIERSGDVTRIGAMTRVTTVATELADYPALALTAGSLANPHTRAVGTIGGNLLQQTRCWYYRTGEVDCFKTGAEGCPARPGLHHFGNLFDTSSCVAPHPSSLGMALTVYDARVEVDGSELREITELWDPIDPRREHTLDARQILTSVVLPPPSDGERAAYCRATAQELAEWPLVEAVCRLFVEGDRITGARIAAGGVGPVPRRLVEVEHALEGVLADPGAVLPSVRLATAGARPAPQAAFKAQLLEGVVLEVLERALRGEGSTEMAVHERGL